jgi:hypothetical protein
MNDIKFEDNSFKCVMSLGMRCFTEIYLKKMSLKKFSGPFDSLFNKNIQSIMYLLTSGIESHNLIHTATSTNEDVIKLNDKNGCRTQHILFDKCNDDSVSYHESMFAHHNLHVPDVLEHFNRCFSRLNFLKDNKIRTLFCVFTHQHYARDIIPHDDEVFELSNMLQSQYNCKLLYIIFSNNRRIGWDIILNDDIMIKIIVHNNSTEYNVNNKYLNEIFMHLGVNESELLGYEDIKI